MNKENGNEFHESEFTSGKFANNTEVEQRELSMEYEEDPYNGFSSRGDYLWDKLYRYMDASKHMMAMSAAHLKNPFTVIVIILLVILYILLGVAGTVSFSFYSGKVVQYINTNLDIIVNAFLGYFYGPVTCAVSVGLCCIAKIIANRSNFFFGYLIGAVMAGFLHGWILYRMKYCFFKPWFTKFWADLLSRVVATRVIISLFINIILMSVLYRVFVHYPFYYFFKYYSKSGVPLNSPLEFIKILVVSIIFESAVVYVSLMIFDFVARKSFLKRQNDVSIVVNKDGQIINNEEDNFDD